MPRVERQDKGGSTIPSKNVSHGVIPRFLPSTSRPAILGLSVLLVSALLAPNAGASHISPDLVFPWAFSGSQNVSGSGNVSTPYGSYGYSFHGSFTDVAVFNQTNTSATTFSITGEQAIQVVYYLTLCQPSCAQPAAQTNVSLTSWQGVDSTAGLTRIGTVYENGSAVPAIALLNDSSSVKANITCLVQWTTPGNSGWWGGGPPSQGFQYLGVTSNATESIAFSPPLGLVPLSEVPGDTWNATSTFNGTQSSWLDFHLASSQGGNVSGNPQSSSPVSGGVSLYGADQAYFTLRNGWLTHALSLALGHGLRFWDGLFLVPSSGDLFLGDGQAWQPQGGPDITGGTSALDFDPSSDHFGLVASSVTFNPVQPDGPIGSQSWAGPSFGPARTHDNPNGPGAVTLQTEPVTATAAQTTASSVAHVPEHFVPLSPAAPGSATLLPWVVLVTAAAIGILSAAAIQGQRRADSRGPRGTEAYDTYRAGLDHPADARVNPETVTATPQEDPFRDLV